jgi:hypothetical protein
MTPPPIPAMTPRGAGLQARRCVRHATREAAARCPACAEFFCRECVVEHAGKLLCAPCLARQATRAQERRERWRGARCTARAAAGGLALWLVFYWIGALLLKIPPDLHDGTVWKKLSVSSPR